MRTDATIRGGGGQPNAPAVGHPTPPPADTLSFASGQPSIPGYTATRPAQSATDAVHLHRGGPPRSRPTRSGAAANTGSTVRSPEVDW